MVGTPGRTSAQRELVILRGLGVVTGINVRLDLFPDLRGMTSDVVGRFELCSPRSFCFNLYVFRYCVLILFFDNGSGAF